jgi:hypothetical protein
VQYSSDTIPVVGPEGFYMFFFANQQCAGVSPNMMYFPGKICVSYSYNNELKKLNSTLFTNPNVKSQMFLYNKLKFILFQKSIVEEISSK